jgi:hypothetical protein
MLLESWSCRELESLHCWELNRPHRGMASLDLLGFERLLPGSFAMGISGVAF